MKSPYLITGFGCLRGRTLSLGASAGISSSSAVANSTAFSSVLDSPAFRCDSASSAGVSMIGAVVVSLNCWTGEKRATGTEAEIQALRSAFTQEVVVWHKLDHPNVTKFIGATMGTTDLNIQTENGHMGMPSNICCVVVEYLPGGALKSYLIKNRRKKLAFKVVVQMALDLARGDVKTENMLLNKARTVKIADFGVARVEASNPNDMTGETGTLGYMAPEVLNGNPYNRKCDVYSLGIFLWEIYCCDMPYPDLSFSEVTSAVVRQMLPKLTCWDANLDKRPEMDEVVTMLEAIDTSKGGGMIPSDQA
ncbi:hypothetical protein SASPL_118764 [Salvia splendens]|uniref:Protein kinase domain-containing protein n=1 Tax=Salvia splendens TaxID=180675 RepID=A0A8X8XYB6_SALSN|nr:hypothetical protein SASPL_118764 [Salvia splendens]